MNVTPCCSVGCDVSCSLSLQGIFSKVTFTLPLSVHESPAIPPPRKHSVLSVFLMSALLVGISLWFYFPFPFVRCCWVPFHMFTGHWDLLCEAPTQISCPICYWVAGGFFLVDLWELFIYSGYEPFFDYICYIWLQVGHRDHRLLIGRRFIWDGSKEVFGQVMKLFQLGRYRNLCPSHLDYMEYSSTGQGEQESRRAVGRSRTANKYSPCANTSARCVTCFISLLLLPWTSPNMPDLSAPQGHCMCHSLCLCSYLQSWLLLIIQVHAQMSPPQRSLPEHCD